MLCDDPLAKAGSSFGEMIDAIAAKFEPRLRAAFLHAVEAKRDSIDRARLEKLIEAQDVPGILDLLGLARAGTTLLPILEPLRGAFAAAGQAVNESPLLARVTFTFDGLNQRAITALRDYGTRLIREITEESRLAVQGVMADLLRDGQNPRRVASALGTIVGLTEQQARAVTNYGSYLRDLRNEALLRRLRDRRFDGTVRRAIESGKPIPEKKVAEMVAFPYVRHSN